MRLSLLIPIVLVSQGLAARCGKDFSGKSCAQDECCSEAGYCGKGPDFCKGPQCQINYSTGKCDADQRPCGKDTKGIGRNFVTDIPYNVIIKKCTVNTTVALTFDDGPFHYTEKVLDLLKQYEAKATFFISGNSLGKGMIDDPTSRYPALIRRMHEEGHQIGSHGWTHQNMDELTEVQREKQIIYNEMAIRNIIGMIPAYFRPPYGICGSGCLKQLERWGYHVVNWDIDTRDIFHNTPERIQASKDIVNERLDPRKISHLLLLHDTQYQTAYNLTEYVINRALKRGYKLTTLGECLGDGADTWYHYADYDDGNNGGDDVDYEQCISPPVNLGLVTPPKPTEDGTCGGRSNNKYTCEGSSYGDCCSYLGFCGSTSGYCNGGCQEDFGRCNTINCGDPPIVSENGLCGGKTHQTCLGSSYGDCCSEHGNCGSGDRYCGTGCQEYFGSCQE